MTPQFRVETSPHFDRLFRKLARKHPDLPGHLLTIREILRSDPYNRTRRRPIKKLVDPQQDGQYRLRLGRFDSATILSLIRLSSTPVPCAARTLTIETRTGSGYVCRR